MILDQSSLKNLSKAAIKAALIAGKFIAKRSNQPIKVEHKEGSESEAYQVVTVVDHQSQEILVSELQSTIKEYDLGLLTEESVDNKTRFLKDYFWCIDPLDGTLPFTESLPGYSVSIALVNKLGVSELGVIYDPVKCVLYRAIKGEGAFGNDFPLKIPPKNEAYKFTFITDRSLLNHPKYNVILKELGVLAKERELNIISHGGAAMNACWVIENSPAVYFKLPKPSYGGGSIWDFAASSCIVKEAGGIATDIFGDKLELNKKENTFMNHRGILYASNSSISDFVKRLFQSLNF